MKVDLTIVLLDLEGVPLNPSGKKIVTLQVACVNALLNPNQPLTGAQKVEDFELAKRISDGGDEFTAEEVVLLKERIGNTCLPAIVARCWAILDPKESNAD